MRRALHLVARVISVLYCLAPADHLLAQTEASNGSTSPAARQSSTSNELSAPIAGDAAQLVRKALAAEAQGDAQARAELLRQAMCVDSSYPPAHWHSGEVRQDDRWMAVDAAVSATVDKGAMHKYRKLRDRMRGTRADHLNLARWCASAGLKDQERTHLIYATYAQSPEKLRRDMLAKLGLVRYRGQLMPQAQANALDRQSRELRSTERDRVRSVAKVKQDFASGRSDASQALLNELGSIPPASRVPVLEAVLLDKKLATPLAEQSIKLLAADPGQSATDALVRQAIFSQRDSTRLAAATTLQDRSLFGYVPTLINALRPPVDLQFRVYSIAGIPHHQLIMSQADASADYIHTSFGIGGSHTEVTTHVIARWPTDVTFTRTPDLTVLADASRAQEVIATNEAHALLNQRVMDTLSVATGNEFDQVHQWLSWWNQYNEMAEAPYRPVVATGMVWAAPVTMHVGNSSCFVAGTLVSTSTGMMPIEEVRVGDSVLAQDPGTGELGFKPVLATTIRPRSGTIDVRTDKATIRATRGHPFWVDGVGWQMAKELKAGQNLHTPQGAIQIRSVNEDLPAECYNLIVADFNSYFVSAAQVLVHDNNLREVTTAIVPGLVEP